MSDSLRQLGLLTADQLDAPVSLAASTATLGAETPAPTASVSAEEDVSNRKLIAVFAVGAALGFLADRALSRQK